MRACPFDEVEALLGPVAAVDEVAGEDEMVDAGDEAAVGERVADELRIAVRVGEDDRASQRGVQAIGTLRSGGGFDVDEGVVLDEEGSSEEHVRLLATSL